VSFTAFLGRVRATGQVVNGLDSTGFSSAGWIATGHQTAYETVRATSPAAIARIDVTPGAGIEVGAAGYVGGSSANRPKPDLVVDCPDGDPDVVAPCGYVSAPVAIGEVHGALEVGRLRGQALAVVGYLGNADVVTERGDDHDSPDRVHGRQVSGTFVERKARNRCERTVSERA